MTFVKSDCIDVISARLNNIMVLNAVINKDICEIHYVYTDESNKNGTNIPGISYWGPAKTSEDAKKIAEFFGYQKP